MRINILSTGRFHVLDLARELNTLGFDVKFYSYVPRRRAIAYGLPSKCVSSYFLLISPFLAIQRVFKGYQWSKNLRIWIQDRIVYLKMRKCDVTIAMSGEFIVSLQKAKIQGSTIIVERGSKHILEQKRILESIPTNVGRKPVSDSDVKRELMCYRMAEYISVAAEHVKESFIAHGFNEKKLFVNPYGVDLSMFKPLPCKKKYDVLFIGAWSYQKGADILLPAVRQLKVQFLHVGSLVDVPFEEDSYCHHHSPVDQKQLVSFYNQAKVFIIPSRQEGLAMVQAQAIACNLPVIGSPNSGAEDLRRMVRNPLFITLIDSYSVESVKAAITRSLEHYCTLGEELYAGDAMSELSWYSYGKRYAHFLKSLSI